MSAGFIEVQLDPRASYGTKGGLVYPAVVVTNPSRIETRYPLTSRGYWNAQISFSDRSKSQMKLIRAHFARVKGKAYGWRWRNWQDYYTCTDDGVGETPGPEPITLYTTGTTMQLQHTRNPGTSEAEIVLIRKPDMDSAGASTGAGTTIFNLYRDGSPTPWPSATNWTLDTTTGIVTFNSNQVGHTFEWLGYWDTPSRFDLDNMEDVEWQDWNTISWSGIKVMEIKV